MSLIVSNTNIKHLDISIYNMNDISFSLLLKQLSSRPNLLRSFVVRGSAFWGISGASQVSQPGIVINDVCKLLAINKRLRKVELKGIKLDLEYGVLPLLTAVKASP